MAMAIGYINQKLLKAEVRHNASLVAVTGVKYRSTYVCCFNSLWMYCNISIYDVCIDSFFFQRKIVNMR